MDRENAGGGRPLSRKAFLQGLLVPAGFGWLLGGGASRGLAAGAGRLPPGAAGRAEALLLDRAGRLWRESVAGLPVRTADTGGARTLAERFREAANLRDHGAGGAGRTDDAPALRAAMAAADSEAVVLPRGAYRLGASLETEPGKTLVFLPGARLVLDRGVELVLRGPVEAGRRHIFDGRGTVRLRANPDVDPRWFGAAQGHDSTAAIQACLDSIGDGTTVRFTGGGDGQTVFATSRTLTLRGRTGVTLRADPGVRIHLESAPSSLLHAEDCTDLALENIDAFGRFEPSPGEHHNKLLVAERCRGVRVDRCRAEGLVLVLARECEQLEVARCFCDTGVDAADFARGHSGFNYGVHMNACRGCIVRHNILRNCVNDGIKFGGLRTGEGEARWSDLKYGADLVVDGNWISGCVNDDAIDIFNSGNRVILSNNVMVDNQKAINAKQGRDPNAPVREIVIQGNLVVGGRWNPALSSLQCGINVDARNLILTGNVIRDIQGLGIYFGSSAASVIIADNLVENITSSPSWSGHQPNGIGIADLASADPDPANPTYNAGREEPMEKRDGVFAISNCIVRECTAYGVLLRHSARGGVDGCVFENIGLRGVWLDCFAADPVPMTVRGCRFGTRNGAPPMEEGIRVGPAATAGAIVSQCVVYGEVRVPLVDESPGRRVRGSDNSWWPTAGTSRERPDGSLCPPGFTFFDTTLEKPVFWTGSAWVDSAGRANAS